MADNYLVIRLVPTSPVDGPTFATYLEDLTITVYQANTNPANKLGGTEPHAAPVSLVPAPWFSNGYFASLSRATSSDTPYDKTSKKYGNTLDFDNTAGIAVGSVPTNQFDGHRSHGQVGQAQRHANHPDTSGHNINVHFLVWRS